MIADLTIPAKTAGAAMQTVLAVTVSSLFLVMAAVPCHALIAGISSSAVMISLLILMIDRHELSRLAELGRTVRVLAS